MWEAMATGKCIFTSDNQAIREVLTDGQNAVLLSSDQENEFPALIKNLLGDDELRKRMGDSARVRAKEVLESWTQRIDREAVFLESLTENHG